MNQYIEKLNFPVPDVNLVVYKSDHRSHTRAPRDILGAEIDRLLAAVNVRIRWVEAFYLGPGADHSIHCDGHEFDTKAKLNYVVGGKGSVMVWYDCIDKSRIEKRTSRANTIYLATSSDNVVETHSAFMDGFYLVNVGMFHNVWNKDDGRYCLSTCLEDMVTHRRLDYHELQNRLKEYFE